MSTPDAIVTAPWFVLFGVVALAAAVLLYMTRVRGLRTQTQELESVVAERTQALRERERELANQNKLLEAQAQQLQALDRAKTRFFANVSHELRTPLTLTIGPLEDLASRGGHDPQETQWIEIALRNSRRLLRLVNQILDVAKLESGQMQLRTAPLDLVLFVRGILGAFSSVAERKRITLGFDAPPALRGAFDADAIEKVVTNLLSNAVKFTPDGGSVRLQMEVTRHDDAPVVLLRVIDTGPGIAPAQLAHVFERFYQVDETDARLQAGTGIGLALVRELVELHGGTIAVDSDVRGTMFTMRIPYAATEAAGARPPRDHQVTGPITIMRPGESANGGANGDGDDNDSADRERDVPTMLVVDDSDDLRMYVRDHFAPHFRVFEARDGAEGVEVARRELPDVVVSDVMMPGTDGFALVRALRENQETDFLGIVLLTAQAEDEKKLAGLKSGADDYLVKPFDMRELDARVRNLIALRRRWRERVAPLREERRNGGSEVIREANRDANRDANREANREAAGDAVREGEGGGDGAGAVVVDTSAPLSPADQQFRDRLLRVVTDRLADPDFGVTELAQEMAQDRSHLFRRVKQVCGVSPSTLLRVRRLERGAQLLREQGGTVADVAYAVGFNSVSYFCQCFLQQYGESPAAARASASRPNPSTG